MPKIIPILLVLSLAAGFCFAAQVPEDLEEAKQVGEELLETGKKELPGILENLWNEQVLPLWQKMHGWFIDNVWPEIEGFFRKEVVPRAESELEARKEIIESEFSREVDEALSEMPGFVKNIWENIKDIAVRLKVLWE